MSEFRPATWDGVSKRSVRAKEPGETVPAAPTIEDIDATDAARAYAAEQNIDLAGVTGTGADGRVTKDDVANHVYVSGLLDPKP